MNKTYYDRLLKKLKFHHDSIRDFSLKREVVVTLTREEIDDLLYIWKYHAEKIFEDEKLNIKSKSADNKPGNSGEESEMSDTIIHAASGKTADIRKDSQNIKSTSLGGEE